jgi:hypothetical protein
MLKTIDAAQSRSRFLFSVSIRCALKLTGLVRQRQIHESTKLYSAAGWGACFGGGPEFNQLSSEVPPKAIAAWKGPENETDVRKWILSYAILAPHSHNLQS